MPIDSAFKVFRKLVRIKKNLVYLIFINKNLLTKLSEIAKISENTFGREFSDTQYTSNVTNHIMNFNTSFHCSLD